VNRYPDRAGHTDEDTSLAAADAIEDGGRAATLRMQCLGLLEVEPMTADEVAALLNESVLSIRPRITELFKRHLIADTGERRENRSGRKAKVMRGRLLE
jgi:hypothetical protein